MIEMLPSQDVGLKTKAAPSNPAASKLRQDSLAARRTLIGLCVKLVEGGKVTDSEIAKARVAADTTASEVAAMIDKLTARKAAYDAYHGTDWDAERAAAKEAVLAALKAKDDCEKEYAAMQTKLREASQHYTSCVGHSSATQRKQVEGARELSATLGRDGDANDWKGIH